MTVLVGTQQNGAYNLTQAYAGDWVSDRGAVTLSAVGKLALGDVTVGNGVFLSTSGNQASNNSTTAGTTLAIGIALRNSGTATMPYNALGLGYSAVIGDGYQISVATAGDVAVVGLGVGTAGTGNHTPALGDLVWVNTTTGAIATAPSTVATVTGYVLLSGWVVSKVGLNLATAYANNQTGIVITK